MSVNFTCLGWWLGVKLFSSVSMSSNDSLFTMGVTVGEFEATAVPHHVFIVPNIKLRSHPLLCPTGTLSEMS